MSKKIQFHKKTWVLYQSCKGFDGACHVKAIRVHTEPIEIISLERDKKTQCSKIYIWSDGCCDGENHFLINVANGLFKEINE